jgi:hypothetical protein
LRLHPVVPEVGAALQEDAGLASRANDSADLASQLFSVVIEGGDTMLAHQIEEAGLR